MKSPPFFTSEYFQGTNDLGECVYIFPRDQCEDNKDVLQHTSLSFIIPTGILYDWEKKAQTWGTFCTILTPAQQKMMIPNDSHVKYRVYTANMSYNKSAKSAAGGAEYDGGVTITVDLHLSGRYVLNKIDMFLFVFCFIYPFTIYLVIFRHVIMYN